MAIGGIAKSAGTIAPSVHLQDLHTALVHEVFPVNKLNVVILGTGGTANGSLHLTLCMRSHLQKGTYHSIVVSAIKM